MLTSLTLLRNAEIYDPGKRGRHDVLVGGGEILASASTIGAAPRVIAYPVGSRTVKGREETVEVFRVVAGG